MEQINKFLDVIYKDNDYIKLLDKNLNLLRKEHFIFDIRSKAFKELIVERYAKKYNRHFDLDEIEHFLEYYLGKMKEKSHVSDNDNYNTSNTINVFEVLSDEFLLINGSRLNLEFNKILKWDALVNVVDVNILIASIKARHNEILDDQSLVIKHDNNRLYRKLSFGYGETHMHFQASGYSTEINWFQFNICPLLETKSYLAIDRKHDIENDIVSKEACLLADMKIKAVRMYLYDLIKFKNQETSSSGRTRVFSDDDLYFIKDIQHTYQFIRYEDRFRQIQDEQRDDLHNNTEGVFKYVSYERDFLTSVFKLMYKNELSYFELYCFNVYLVALCKFKFSLVQDDNIMGFEYFKKYEGRKKLFINDDLKHDLYMSVFDKYYREGNVRFIELRIGPKDKEEFLDFIKQIQSAHNQVFESIRVRKPDIEKIKLGIIIHYIKDKKKESYDIRGSRRLKFIEYLDKISNDLTQILQADEMIDFDIVGPDGSIREEVFGRPRELEGTLNSHLVGVDAANYELNCRPEIFAPTFRKHRLDHTADHLFGFTYHVGEAFKTLCNGLRAIDETVSYFDYRRGDRLGHAIALGINVDLYFETKKNKIITNLQDHLDDIAWMYDIISDYSNNNHETLAYLQRCIDKYKNLLYGDRVSPDIDTYIKSLSLRGDDIRVYNAIDSAKGTSIDYNLDTYKKMKFNHTWKLNTENKKHCEAFISNDARQVYLDYHYNELIRKNGEKNLIEKADIHYKEALILAQKILKEKVIRMGIVVEVNPSSNKKISSAAVYSDIQLLGLNNHHLSKYNGENHVMVSINTDDSAVFQTDVGNEYSLLAATLIEAGNDVEEVYDYIDYLRSMSEESTFIAI